MPRSGDSIHIPLPTEQALAGLLAVKPTADMPGQGKGGKRKKAKKKRTR